MNKLSISATMFASIGLLASCSANDPIPEEEENIARENQTLYVKVSVHGENGFGSRAGAEEDGDPVAETDFEGGTPAESEVKTLYFVFYNNEGEIVGNITNVDLTGSRTPSDPGPTVETVYENTVTVTLMKGEEKPTKLMCYVNPVSLSDIQKPLSVIQTVTRETVQGANGFPMSNSVYYPTDVTSSTPDNGATPLVAVNIDGKVYDTKEAAENAANPAVDIYVERRAARMTFKVADGIYDAASKKVEQTYTSATGSVKDANPAYELTLYLDGWDVNAQTKTTYLVKSFRERDAATGQILANDFTYQEANEKINKNGGNWKWNKPEYHRSYWAVSPAYFTNSYPEVASDVKNSSDLPLQYILPDGWAWKTDLTGKTTEYYREATVGLDALASNNPAAAVASVVLKGHYTIGDKEVDFYSYQKGAEGKYLVFPANAADVNEPNCVTMMQRFMQIQSVLYRKVDGNYVRLTQDDVATFYPQLTIMHPAMETLAADPSVTGSEDMKVASRHQTLQLTGVPAGTVATLYYASGNGYVEVTSANLKNVNLALIRQLGFANFYNKGQAWFNIPIKHLGWYRTANTQKDLPNIDWSLVRVGDFGMVRNHAYDIEVQEIKGLGTAIGDPTDPIIPPAENKDYYVKYKVNCLKWALAPKQSVNL